MCASMTPHCCLTQVKISKSLVRQHKTRLCTNSQPTDNSACQEINPLVEHDNYKSKFYAVQPRELRHQVVLWVVSTPYCLHLPLPHLYHITDL